MDRKNDLLRERRERNRNMPLRLVVLVGMFGRRSVSRKLGREENERKENEHGHAHADGDKEDQVILGFGQDQTGIVDSGALPVSQLPTIPADTTTGITVTGATPGDITGSVVNVGPQTAQNTLSYAQLAQFVSEYGGLPQTGQPVTTPASTGTSTSTIILMVAGFGIFLMAISGGGSKRR
jgi:hypothetical protein